MKEYYFPQRKQLLDPPFPSLFSHLMICGGFLCRGEHLINGRGREWPQAAQAARGAGRRSRWLQGTSASLRRTPPQ